MHIVPDPAWWHGNYPSTQADWWPLCAIQKARAVLLGALSLAYAMVDRTSQRAPRVQRVSVERGVSGVAPGVGPEYVALCHFLFESLDDFMAAVTPNLAALQADMKNYTDIEPIFQASEVLIFR